MRKNHNSSNSPHSSALYNFGPAVRKKTIVAGVRQSRSEAHSKFSRTSLMSSFASSFSSKISFVVSAAYISITPIFIIAVRTQFQRALPLRTHGRLLMPRVTQSCRSTFQSVTCFKFTFKVTRRCPSPTDPKQKWKEVTGRIRRSVRRSSWLTCADLRQNLVT